MTTSSPPGEEVGTQSRRNSPLLWTLPLPLPLVLRSRSRLPPSWLSDHFLSGHYYSAISRNLGCELRRMNTFVRHPSRARMKHGTDVTEVRWKCDDRMEVVVYRVKSSADLCLVSNSMWAPGERAMFSGRYSSTLIVCQGAISRENAIVRPLNFHNVLQSRLSRAYMKMTIIINIYIITQLIYSAMNECIMNKCFN